jgi:hypothetical protein
MLYIVTLSIPITGFKVVIPSIFHPWKWSLFSKESEGILQAVQD